MQLRCKQTFKISENLQREILWISWMKKVSFVGMENIDEIYNFREEPESQQLSIESWEEKD